MFAPNRRQLPHSTVWPASVATAAVSRTRLVLPAPASPTTMTALGDPAADASSAERSI